jgi:integrase
MASSWIGTWKGANGSKRYRVRYRLGGRTSKALYGGSFRSQREARICKQYIDGELAAGRVPVFDLLVESPMTATLAEAAQRYRDSRVDVAENTKSNMRVALDQVIGVLGRDRHIDTVTSQDVADAISKLTAEGYARETIRKGVNYLGATFDFEGIEPNPVRDKLRVRLPRGQRRELEPPTAEHVEAVYRRLPAQHRLALLWLDWSGARVASVDLTLVGDYDQGQRRVRIRAEASKTRRGLWVELPDVLADAIEATLPHPKFRDPPARLFAESSSDALRTSMAKACRAEGIPVFSPHDLRHRRISLLHKQGRSWAEIGAFVGQRSLKVTSDTYTHVIVDGREIDLPRLVAEVV